MQIGAAGYEVPCVLDHAGQARDVSGFIADFGPETLAAVSEQPAGKELTHLGAGLKPPQLLAPGDVVKLEINGLATQRQTVVHL